MRARALRVVGFLCLVLGLLALPAAALAAPQISITPKQGPNSTLFLVTGVGFTPSTTYYLQVAPQGGGTPIKFDDASAKSDADGVIVGGFSFGGGVAAGNYVASINTAASGGTALASVAFTLTGTSGAKPGPDIVITPAQGASGSTFVLTGTGFAPSTTYTLRLQTENRQTTIALNKSDVSSEADGTILAGFGLAAGGELHRRGADQGCDADRAGRGDLRADRRGDQPEPEPLGFANSGSDALALALADPGNDPITVALAVTFAVAIGDPGGDANPLAVTDPDDDPIADGQPDHDAAPVADRQPDSAAEHPHGGAADPARDR